MTPISRTQVSVNAKILSSKKETEPFDISICPLLPSYAAEISHRLLFKPRLLVSSPLFIPRCCQKKCMSLECHWEVGIGPTLERWIPPGIELSANLFPRPHPTMTLPPPGLCIWIEGQGTPDGGFPFGGRLIRRVRNNLDFSKSNRHVKKSRTSWLRTGWKLAFAYWMYFRRKLTPTIVRPPNFSRGLLVDSEGGM